MSETSKSTGEPCGSTPTADQQPNPPLDFGGEPRASRYPGFETRQAVIGVKLVGYNRTSSGPRAQLHKDSRSRMRTSVRWADQLASRDTSANALWEPSYEKGSHPTPVLADDTWYAASRVIEKRERVERAGIVGSGLVGVKNETPARLSLGGDDLFESKFDQRVLEIEREVLLPKRVAIS